jgi:coenzyme F420-dependent glucose-6-phosphate dehydrogenase
MKLAWGCSSERYQPEALLEQAVQAEHAGFDAVFVSDAFHPWVDEDSASGFVWTWLGAAAARASRIELVTTVTAPLFRYHPAVIAQAAATVDRLSEGRFVLGVGTGDAINDAPLGAQRIKYRERAARLREAADIIHRLWAGEHVTLDGAYYRTDRARLFSPPTGPLRMWMGAAGPKSARLAAEVAEGIVSSVRDTDITLTEVLAPYRQASDGQGTVALTRWTILAHDEEEAWRALGAMRGLRVPGRKEAVDPATLRHTADSLPRAEVLGRYPIAADAEGLVGLYRPLVEDLAADYVSVQVMSTDPAATIRMLGEKVLPVLRSIAAQGSEIGEGLSGSIS